MTVIYDFYAKHPDAFTHLEEIFGDAGGPRDVHFALSSSTGIISLDFMLGGGLPSGVTEISGEESTGKTTLLATIAAAAQSRGFMVGLCQTEYWDPRLWGDLGVDLADLLMLPTGTEDLMRLLGDFLPEPRSMVLVDSLTSLRPLDAFWGQVVLEFVERARNCLGDESCAVVTNQVRQQLSIQPGRTFTKDTESASRLDVNIFDTRLELSRDHVTEDSYTMQVDITKSVTSVPTSWTRVRVKKGKGVEVGPDFLDIAGGIGAITKAGSHLYFKGTHLGRGREEALRALEGNKNLQAQVLDTVIEFVKNG